MTHDDTRLARPFEVAYDTEEGEYYIFAPAGCVLVNGVAVGIKDADSNGNVSLNLDPDNLPDRLWAHVSADGRAEGGYVVEFDDEDEKAGAEWNFCVTRFGASEDDGNQYDIATGVVNLGGGEAKPHPYEVRQRADGTLVIWLPDDDLFVYGHDKLDVHSGLTPEASGSSWYIFSNIQTCASIGVEYGVYVQFDPSAKTVRIIAEVDPYQPHGSYGAYVYRLASMVGVDTTAGQGESGEDVVTRFAITQFVDSAIVLFAGSDRIPGCYEIVLEERQGSGGGTVKVPVFANRYYEVSGVIHEGPSGDVGDFVGKFCAIRVSRTTGVGLGSVSATLVGYNSFSDLVTEMSNVAYCVIPLYKFDQYGGIACDLRHLPRADMWSIGFSSDTTQQGSGNV